MLDFSACWCILADVICCDTGEISHLEEMMLLRNQLRVFRRPVKNPLVFIGVNQCTAPSFAFSSNFGVTLSLESWNKNLYFSFQVVFLSCVYCAFPLFKLALNTEEKGKRKKKKSKLSWNWKPFLLMSRLDRWLGQWKDSGGSWPRSIRWPGVKTRESWKALTCR